MQGNIIAIFAIAAFFGVEAFKNRENRVALIVLGSLASVLTLSAVFLPALTEAFPKVGGFIEGAFDDPSSWLFIGIALFFVLRPFWSRSATAPGIPAIVGYDDAKLRAEVAALSALKRQIVDDYQRMLGLENRYSGMLDGLKEAIQKKDETLGANLAALQDKLGVLDATYAAEVRGLKAHESLTADALKHRFDSIYKALGAIFHRERLINLGRMIEDASLGLSAATHSQTSYDEARWEQWSVDHRNWNILVHEWCDLAENYVAGISAKILTTTSEHYQQKGEAKVDQFPDAEAYIAYKVFCAILKNWKNWQLEALHAVHRVAFNGGGRVPVSGGGDMEYLGGNEG